MKTTLFENSMKRASSKRVWLAMQLFLVCFVLSIAQAVTPPPGGAYPGRNTAAGMNALLSLTDGRENTALGSGALEKDTVGNANTAAGAGALNNNRGGNQNTATGLVALESGRADNGPDNIAFGYRALDNNNGSRNTAIGWNTLPIIFEGTDNIALGHSSGRNLSNSDSFNIDIGHRGFEGENRVIRIGDPDHVRTFIAGVFGPAAAGAVALRVNATGQLGVAPSSKRFKDEITSMGNTSEAILALKPVTFRYKKEIDPKRTQQFGLVAERWKK